MDRATSRPGRPLRRRHDGVDADCAGAAAPSRGGNRSATGHRYRPTVAAVSRLVAWNPPSRFCTGTTSTIMSLGCATSAASRQSTVEQWSRTTKRFLLWCAGAGRELGDLTAGDIDNYVATQGTGRWARVSTANVISALCAFLRYAAQEGWCSNRLAKSISRPRLYQQESLPYAPDWSAVQQMLADVDTDKPRDIRDRAILLLLALYGMRSGEVAALQLDQIDWAGRTINSFG